MQAHPTQAVVLDYDRSDLTFNNADPTSGQLFHLLVSRIWGRVQEQDHVRAPLPEQQGLVHRHRPAGQDTDRLVTHLPPVAVRAVQDLAPPPLGQPRHAGQLVDKASGDKQPPRQHRCTVGEHNAEIWGELGYAPDDLAAVTGGS